MPDPAPTSLEVVLTLPPAPLVLASAGFLSTLSQVEQEIAAMAVTDGPSAQAAANTQTRLTQAGSTLEKQRKALKEPFLEAGRAIDAAAQAPAARIEAAKGKVKRLLADYDAAERAKAALAEKARLAEIARLQKIAADEAAEEKRKTDAIAAELAAKAVSAPAAEEWDAAPEEPAPVQKTETEKRIEALVHAPAVVAPRPAGVTMKVTLVATVIDPNKLPDVFVERVPKTDAIRKLYCVGWKDGQAIPVLDGVKFEVSRVPVSTGRSAF